MQVRMEHVEEIVISYPVWRDFHRNRHSHHDELALAQKWGNKEPSIWQ